jgi:hypothetical protein
METVYLPGSWAAFPMVPIFKKSVTGFQCLPRSRNLFRHSRSKHPNKEIIILFVIHLSNLLL